MSFDTIWFGGQTLLLILLVGGVYLYDKSLWTGKRGERR